MQLKPGTLLQGGKYRILNAAEVLPKHKNVELGQGGFGITYLAEHTTLGKRVCIKEFFMKELNLRSEDGSITGLSEGTLSYNYARKFRKEAMNLARMEHPNIVRVTDSFDENGTFYYVMDYIEGQNLNGYIEDHILSESEAISIIKDVANALIYMHEKKHMLHLDLKPGNIMRRASDGHIFLIDFGLSKHYDKNGTPETSTTIGGGTPGYAPTEQGDKAKDGEFRPTIDVYALGATLFKLLTRETPPTASEVVNDDEILAEKLSNNGVSQNVIDLVVKAMKPGYKKRIQTMREFIAALPGSTESVNGRPNRHYTTGNFNQTNGEETTATNSSNTPPNAKGFREDIHDNTTPQDKDKREKDAEKSDDEIIGDAEEFILNSLPKVKFGFWLKFFLFVICYCGLGSILAPIFHWDYFDQSREVTGYGLVVFGVLQTILALLTIKAFRKRKPDAVFLGKLSTIVICIADLLYVLTNCDGSVGIQQYAPFVRGLVTAIVWFIYLCVSKRVDAVIPSYCRKTQKRDYILCAVFALSAIYLFLASQIVESIAQEGNIENTNGNRVVNQTFEDSNGESFSYTGEVRNGLPNGMGEGIYSFGRYVGPYKDGLMHGADGKFTEKGGATFVGSFDNDYYSEGTLMRTDGTWFVGKMKNGAPFQGTEYYKDGKIKKQLK